MAFDVNPCQFTIALYQWYRDWATTARAVLGRKSLQIALGLASRSRRGAAHGGSPEEVGDIGVDDGV